MNIEAHIIQRAQDKRLLILDVDGVLTDGRLYFSEQGETLKCFNTLDGHGLKLLQASGVQVAIISGRDSKALRVRLQTLGIEHLFLGTEDKAIAAQQLLQQLGISWSEVVVVGDDWPDLPLFAQAGLAIAPANAHIEVKKRAHWIPQEAAGKGLVRAVCDAIMIANHYYDQALQKAIRGQ